MRQIGDMTPEKTLPLPVGFVLRALLIARWDVRDARDAWDDGFLKFAFGASRWNLANHRQRASRRNQNRRIQCNRQGALRRI